MERVVQSLAAHDCCPQAGDLSSEPLRGLLELFLQMGVYSFTILDDTEVYEKQIPFSLAELQRIAGFCNQLGFQMIWEVRATARHEHLTSGLNTIRTWPSDNCR